MLEKILQNFYISENVKCCIVETCRDTPTHMEIIKRLIAIWKVPEEIERLKKLSRYENIENYSKNILRSLRKPKTTKQVAKELKISRSWASEIINSLEKEGKVFEFEKKGRTIFYKKS